MPIDLQPRVWYNPELESAKFLVPGLIAFILMVTAVISTALAIVRERELGTMEQLMVSPIKPLELILGKTIPYTIISLIATVAILFLGYLLFDVSIKGSILLLSLVTFVFLVGSLGMGLLISTLVETQQLAFHDCCICFYAADVYSFRICFSHSQYADHYSGNNLYFACKIFSRCSPCHYSERCRLECILGPSD